MTTTMSLMNEMHHTLRDISTYLPQLHGFILQYNTISSENNISIVMDTAYNLSLRVPEGMSPETATRLSNRMGTLDNLIVHHRNEISSLLRRGFEIERGLRSVEADYTSQLHEHAAEYSRIMSKIR